VARELMKMGFADAEVLKGGWREWEKARYPVEKK
jgi:3-mercaptopyruvate sulfurtransferase SseA